MEQEIMQNANFEWLATLFVGIFSAFAGTFLGAVLLNHLQKIKIYQTLFLLQS